MHPFRTFCILDVYFIPYSARYSLFVLMYSKTHITHSLPSYPTFILLWCWVNFQCRGVLLIWIVVGQGPTAPAVGAGEGCLDILTLVYHFSPFSPSLWETARYRLKYCLKGPLNPNQPTNQGVVGWCDGAG